jgi:hypothetical protein
MHPLIQRAERALTGIATAEPLALAGAWSHAKRGATDDFIWRGAVDCAQPVAGVLFLHSGSALHWVKSPPARTGLSVQISLHRNPAEPERATFTGALGNARVTGVAVRCGPDPVAACAIGASDAATGRAQALAEVDGTAIVVLWLPGEWVRTGRNRLWRLRNEWARDLPADVRELLTLRRSGTVPA